MSDCGSSAEKPAARATKMPSPLIQVQFSVALPLAERQPEATMYRAPSGERAFSGPWSTTESSQDERQHRAEQSKQSKHSAAQVSESIGSAAHRAGSAS